LCTGTYEASGQHISVEGVFEEVKSDLLYTAEKMLDITPRVLPVVEIQGKRYYRDDRLREFRNVDDPHDRIDIS
jgi:hypothetical protein